MTLTVALVAAATSIGAVHTLAPDHWVPFAALARAERWSAWRTTVVTAACGLGHVTASVALGLLGLVFGLELLQTVGHRLDSVSGLLLIGFGVAYGLWGLNRAVSAHAHSHAHAHGHVHAHMGIGDRGLGIGCDKSDLGHPDPRSPIPDPAHRPLTAWSLFLLFSADPCVAVIPLLFASAPLGWMSTVAVIVAYELATIGTMVLLVLPARAVATAAHSRWADKWGDALAGGVVATIGVAVILFGI